MMSELTVPTINNNDTHALLVEWCVADGAEVSEGEVVAVLETSKSTFDFEAPGSGPLRIEKPAGEEYAFGERIGWIGAADAAELETATPSNQAAGPTGAPAADAVGDLVLTRAARTLVDQRGVSAEALATLGKRVVRTRDIERLLGESKPDVKSQVEAQAPETGETDQQSAIARVVTRSHREIPAAFLLKRIDCGPVLDRLQALSQSGGKLISLPDLVVHEVARLLPEFPTVFGTVDSRGQAQPGTVANVGVTFDFGKGLFVPVIEQADQLDLAAIAKVMMRYRMRAMRGRFSESELSGGTLSLSLNMDPDTVFVRPLILPPQVCMLSIGAVMTDLALGPEGQPVERRSVQLGMAYDHRVINGYDSQQFTAALKDRIENGAADTA